MFVRAKLVCEGKKELAAGEYEINLRAVYSGSKENEEFFKYTPAAYCQLATVNPRAAELFEPGKEYYVDFTPADG